MVLIFYPIVCPSYHLQTHFTRVVFPCIPLSSRLSHSFVLFAKKIWFCAIFCKERSLMIWWLLQIVFLCLLKREMFLKDFFLYTYAFHGTNWPSWGCHMLTYVHNIRSNILHMLLYYKEFVCLNCVNWNLLTILLLSNLIIIFSFKLLSPSKMIVKCQNTLAVCDVTWSRIN